MIKNTAQLFSANIDTPIGQLLAIANDKALWALSFIDSPKHQYAIDRVTSKTCSDIKQEGNAITDQITRELSAYFNGDLTAFKTPLHFVGTPFQIRVWQALQRIPTGTTESYSTLATMIGKPTATRAVANANGANLLSIVVPCHRIIQKDGSLGGYASGTPLKAWLLKHESR